MFAGRTNDPGFRAAVEEIARDNARIEFRNELDYIEVVRLMRRADIVLVPSRDDAGPMTAVDALGTRKVLVVSRTCGVSFHLTDGESGFVLRDNGPDDICAVLRRAFEQRLRWPEIGANARNVYEAHFTRPRFKEELLKALNLKP